MPKKTMYSFSLPSNITREDINKRAEELGVPKVARLFDFATNLITKCSTYFFKYLDDLASIHLLPSWVIIEQIIIDYKARRDAYVKYWGETPQASVMYQVGADREPVTGEKLYQSLYHFYEQQEMVNYERNWLARDYTKLDAEGKKIVDELRRQHGWKR